MAENMNLITGYQGEPHITSADDGVINAAIFGKGSYVLEIGEKFRAEIVTNNQIRVYDGAASIQGRVARIEPSTYVDIAVDNGSQGMKRNDLICIRYEKDSDTLIEAANIVIIKGTESAGTATDPSYTEGDILNGDLVAEYPIYRVELDGLSIDNIAELGKSVRNLDEVVPVAKGGTGATTVSGARANLGIGNVASEDILPIAKGGTGATTKVGARTNLGIGDVAVENILPLAKGGTGVTSLNDLKEAIGISNAKVKFANIGHNNSVDVVANNALIVAYMTANIYGIYGCWGNNVHQLVGGSGVSSIGVTSVFVVSQGAGYNIENKRSDGNLRVFIFYND